MNLKLQEFENIKRARVCFISWKWLFVYVIPRRVVHNFFQFASINKFNAPVNFNNRDLKNSFKIFIKLLFRHIEHLDSLGERYAKRLMIWVNCTIKRTLFINHMFRIFLFRPCNCKQWPKHQQSWANHCFIIDGLERIYNTSLIDVYELMIHATIQQESPLICIVKLTFSDKYEPLSIKIFKMEKTRSNNRYLSVFVLVICIRTYN